MGFYSRLYSDGGVWRPKLDGVSFKSPSFRRGSGGNFA